MPDHFDLVFLGVGNGFCPELGNNNVLLQGKDNSLLIDCGCLTPLRLIERGDLREMEHILITHVHSDHVGGLELVALLNRYSFRKRPHLYLHEDLWDELWEKSLRGGLEKSQDGNGQPTVSPLSDYFEVHLLEGEKPSFSIPGLPSITLVPTVHVKGKPAFSLFLGDSVFYSSDSQLLPPTLGLDQEPLSAIFQDCQLGGPVSVHTTLERLSELPLEQKKSIYLMHYCLGYESVDAKSLGFRGFVPRGKKISL